MIFGMVLGYHLIFTAYGFWLPNDPRGSWSDFVRSWELVRFGKATKVETRKSVAGVAHDWRKRLEAKGALKYSPVHFTGVQAVDVMEGIREVGQTWGLAIYACSILPKHVHLVIGRTGRPIRSVMNQMKGRASLRLVAEGRHPFQTMAGKGGRPSCWARKGWHVFLDSPGDMWRAIQYVEENPIKEGYRTQRWSMVRGYTEWGSVAARRPEADR
jgi:REP element-mobilizing transposase RayT